MGMCAQNGPQSTVTNLFTTFLAALWPIQSSWTSHAVNDCIRLCTAQPQAALTRNSMPNNAYETVALHSCVLNSMIKKKQMAQYNVPEHCLKCPMLFKCHHIKL